MPSKGVPINRGEDLGTWYVLEGVGARRACIRAAMAMHANSKSAMDEAKENAAAVKTVIRWVQENLSRDDVSALIAGLGGARDAETMPLIKSYPYGAADRDDAAAEIVELLRAKLDEADFAKIAPLVDDVLASVSAKSGLGPDVDWPVIDEDNRAGGHFGGLRGKGSLGINPHGSGAMNWRRLTPTPRCSPTPRASRPTIRASPLPFAAAHFLAPIASRKTRRMRRSPINRCYRKQRALKSIIAALELSWGEVDGSEQSQSR